MSEMTDEEVRLTECLAAWMLSHGLATGHGDTFEDLLDELGWQIEELRKVGNEHVQAVGGSRGL